MNEGECSDHGRHSFKCKCPKATKNSTGYTDSICQTPVFFNFIGELSADGDGGATDSVLAGDQHWEFIGLAAALFLLLLVLVFLAMRHYLRGNERVYINERGEAYVMDEATGATKRADFDVDVMMAGKNLDAFHDPATTHLRNASIAREVRTRVVGVIGSSSVSRNGASSDMISRSLSHGLRGSIFNLDGSSSELTSSSSDAEDSKRLKFIERLASRRDSTSFYEMAASEQGSIFNHRSNTFNTSRSVSNNGRSPPDDRRSPFNDRSASIDTWDNPAWSNFGAGGKSPVPMPGGITLIHALDMGISSEEEEIAEISECSTD
jgi:hypothetical protein